MDIKQIIVITKGAPARKIIIDSDGEIIKGKEEWLDAGVARVVIKGTRGETISGDAALAIWNDSTVPRDAPGDEPGDEPGDDPGDEDEGVESKPDDGDDPGDEDEGVESKPDDGDPTGDPASLDDKEETTSPNRPVLILNRDSDDAAVE